MTTKMLLLVSRFKNYSIAGTTYPYTSVSSLYHVKQIDNVSNICDLTLEQDTPDGYEVSKENKFSISHRIVYNVSDRNFQNFQTNVSHYSGIQSKFSVRNASLCQGKCNHILNVDAPVFYMNLNTQNELSLKYNVYAKVFIPANLDGMCNEKYTNNAGRVVNRSAGHGSCDNNSSNTLLKMPDVSLISSHGTAHLNVVQGLDNFHTSCGSSERVSTLISIHDNLYTTSFDGSDFSHIFNVLVNDTPSHFQHSLWGKSSMFSLCNHSNGYGNDDSYSYNSSSLVDREGGLQGGSVLAISDDEDLSNTNGQPGVLVEIPQHEECVVKNTVLQTSFKGAYGSVAFIIDKFTSTSNTFSPNSLKDRRAVLGDRVEGCHQHHSIIAGQYCRRFGFLPLIQYQFSSYKGSGYLQTSDMVQWITEAHQAVRKSKQFNYQSSRIPVPSGLNIDNWRRYLVGYDLSILCEYLQYGFPLNVDYDNFQSVTRITNHASALRNPGAVDQYFADEISHKAMVGPLTKSPFKDTHYSPLLTRAKSDGGTRVIVDLSSPLGAGVNQFVPSDIFDFMEFQLKYPTIDHIVQKINDIGPDALLYKVNLQRAFRNLKIDPFDYKVLGLMWRSQTFIDVSLAFGFKQGASACQLTTDAVTYLMWTQRHWVANYLDDIIGVSPPLRRRMPLLH